LVYIEKNMGSVQISGFFSQPDFFERHHCNYIYVNSRPVKYPRIYRTIIEAYQNPKNIPAFLVNIQVDPAFVDVNIHPTKSEVKFRDERYILDLLTQVIKKAVFKTSSTVDSITRQRGTEKSGSTVYYAHPEHSSYIQETIIPYTSEETKMDTGEFWQLHNTYILAQTKSGLIIVDQHVAHERIIYESIMEGKQDGQRLLFPITLELTPEEYRAYKNTIHILKQFGVEFKEFSARTIVIDSLPTYAQVNREEIMGLFNEINALGNLIKQKSEIAKVLACRSAIKAGQKLSPGEMQDLIDKLFACENPYTCPHGRPIILKFSLEDLGARFGRE
jgi:DNA mismatch repair protein MutL